MWWWDSDNHMLITHTIHLKEAHNQLQLRGFFETLSKGTERGMDHNCFAFPLRDGAWAVRRYSTGIQEHPSWDQDPNGWTKCFFNRVPSFEAACRSFEGLEDPSGGFNFRDAIAAKEATNLLGANLMIPDRYLGRKCRLKQHKDGRVIIELDADSNDRGDEMTSWLQKKGSWIKMHNISLPDPTEPDVGNYDDTVRHLVTESGEDYGWVLKSDEEWKHEPLAHTRIALTSIGVSQKDSQMILGSAIFRCWTVVNKPFQDEYPGNREWNRNAAQFRFKPTQSTEGLKTTHWDMILNHVGASLDDAVSQSAWAKANGLKRGADYLRCWIASLFQRPLAILPYLFLYGPQNSGKSILHEALSLLLTKGYKKAEQALISGSGFNGELEGAILCVVEEIDLSKAKQAYNRIKDWVTARELSIHAKGKTPFHIPNSTHWIQVANDHSYCPIFPGDTRITTCYVPELDPLTLIPKGKLMRALEDEASDFLATVLRLEIPESNDRLSVPVMTTEDKGVMEQMNQTPLDMFIAEKTKPVEGYRIKFSEFFDQLQKWVDPDDVVKHTKIFVSKNIPPQYPKGRSTKDAQLYIGNIAWIDEVVEEQSSKYVFRSPFLRLMEIKPEAEVSQ